MDEWVRFLGARLAEDEAEIRKHPDQGPYEPDGYLATAEQNYPCDSYLQIGKSRALADIAAKRKIIDAYEACLRRDKETARAGKDTVAYARAVSLLCEPHRQHPEYPGERNGRE